MHEFYSPIDDEIDEFLTWLGPRAASGTVVKTRIEDNTGLDEMQYPEGGELPFRPAYTLTLGAEVNPLRKLTVALESPPYNFILHTAPFGEGHVPHYHWHLEIMPTLTKVAGFEWGSGFYINPTSPEDAASFLRELSP